jgi:hypothetical protein
MISTKQNQDSDELNINSVDVMRMFKINFHLMMKNLSGSMNDH